MTASRAPARSLVDAARAGDEEAWQRIVADFGPRIRGYARARGASDADDLVQDVFVAAAERIGDFDGDDTALRSWLFSIAYRQIVNRYRTKDRQPVELPVTLVDADPGPEAETVDAATAHDAMAALDVLGDVERDVVLMRVLGDLDTKDVAAAVGKRPGTVRVIQSRALTKLRAELRRRGYAGVSAWGAVLAADVIGPVNAAAAAKAAAAVGSGAIGAAASVGVSAAVKTAAAIAVTAALGAGAAATGTLPDPMQRWVADRLGSFGIAVPRPDTNPLINPHDRPLGRVVDEIRPTLDTLPAIGQVVPTIPDPASTPDSVDTSGIPPLEPPDIEPPLPVDPEALP